MDGIGPRAPEPGDSWRVTTGGPRGTRMLRWSKGHTGAAGPDGATHNLVHLNDSSEVSNSFRIRNHFNDTSKTGPPERVSKVYRDLDT